MLFPRAIFFCFDGKMRARLYTFARVNFLPPREPRPFLGHKTPQAISGNIFERLLLCAKILRSTKKYTMLPGSRNNSHCLRIVYIGNCTAMRQLLMSKKGLSQLFIFVLVRKYATNYDVNVASSVTSLLLWRAAKKPPICIYPEFFVALVRRNHHIN